MNGKVVIATLLLDYAPRAERVPDDRVHIARLPAGTGLNNLLVQKVSGTDLRMLIPGEKTRVTDRIQVTTRARDDETRDLIQLDVGRACSDKVGDIGGAEGVSVISDGESHDFDDDDASIFMGSRDFLVSYLVVA